MLWPDIQSRCDMMGLAKQTAAYQGFVEYFDQSVRLAQAVRVGGLFHLLQPALIGRALVSRDTAPLQAQANLGVITAPRVLFVLLMTMTEAFLVNMVGAICATDSNFLPRAEDEMRKIRVTWRPSKSNDDIDRVHQLFYGTSLEQLTEMLDTALDVPFRNLCQKGHTTPEELEKARQLRHLHLHRQGIIDGKFQKAWDDPNNPSLKIGDRFPITYQYLSEIKDKIYDTATEMDAWATSHCPGIQ